MNRVKRITLHQADNDRAAPSLGEVRTVIVCLVFFPVAGAVALICCFLPWLRHQTGNHIYFLKRRAHAPPTPLTDEGLWGKEMHDS